MPTSENPHSHPCCCDHAAVDTIAWPLQIFFPGHAMKGKRFFFSRRHGQDVVAERPALAAAPGRLVPSTPALGVWESRLSRSAQLTSFLLHGKKSKGWIFLMQESKQLYGGEYI